MKKTGIFFLLFVIFCLFAALYGIIHDQITYTVSEEYYSKFKFIQFGIPPSFHNRIGAGLVGVYATWWMGIVIGLFLIPIGLIIPEWKNYFWGMIRAIGIVTITALTVGLGALLIGYIGYNSEQLYFDIPSNISKTKRFYLCGHMHNFSYIGGLIGIVTGIAWIIRERKRAIKNKNKVAR